MHEILLAIHESDETSFRNWMYDFCNELSTNDIKNDWFNDEADDDDWDNPTNACLHGDLSLHLMQMHCGPLSGDQQDDLQETYCNSPTALMDLNNKYLEKFNVPRTFGLNDIPETLAMRIRNGTWDYAPCNEEIVWSAMSGKSMSWFDWHSNVGLTRSILIEIMTWFHLREETNVV